MTKLTDTQKATKVRRGVKQAHGNAKDDAATAALLAQILGATGDMDDSGLAGLHDSIQDADYDA